MQLHAYMKAEQCQAWFAEATSLALGRISSLIASLVEGSTPMQDTDFEHLRRLTDSLLKLKHAESLVRWVKFSP